HEAGHAVAFYWLKLGHYPVPSMRRATIVPGKETLGHVKPFTMPGFHPDYDSSPRVRLGVEGRIMFLLAGRIAERRHLALPPGGPGHAHDHTNAERPASSVSGTQQEESVSLHWLTLRTKTLITVHWASVEAVAKPLLEHRTPTGKRVCEITRADLDRQKY